MSSASDNILKRELTASILNDKIQQTLLNNKSSNPHSASTISNYDNVVKGEKSVAPIFDIDYSSIKDWVKKGDQSKFMQTQCRFINCTLPVAVTKPSLYTSSLSRSPHTCIFSCAIVAIADPLNSQEYRKILLQQYPLLKFDTQLIGKFHLWPPSCQLSNRKIEDNIIHGIIKLYIDRRNEITNKFTKRVDKVEKQIALQKLELEEEIRSYFQSTHRQNESMNDNDSESMTDEKNNAEVTNEQISAYFENQQHIRKLAEEKAAEEIKQKPNKKDFKFAAQFVHDIRLDMNTNFLEVDDEKDLTLKTNNEGIPITNVEEAVDMPYVYLKEKNSIVIKKDFVFPAFSPVMQLTKYAVITFIELYDSELMNNPILNNIKGLKGILKCSGFTTTQAEAHTLMEECNKRYLNIIPHYVVQVGCFAPYPPRRQYFKDVSIDDSESNNQRTAHQFIKEYHDGQKKMQETVKEVSMQEALKQKLEEHNKQREQALAQGVPAEIVEEVLMTDEQKALRDEEKNLNTLFNFPETLNTYSENDTDMI